MSDRDLHRVSVISRMVSGELTSLEGAELLAVSLRQVKRLKKRYVAGGPKGLRHALLGKVSNRQRAPRERARAWRSYVSATEAGPRKEPDRDLVPPWPPSSSKKMRAW